ncbi:anthranilate phosphoribosyltransferase [Candidatus Micrarchaeota archaeon]|nr:anthranilate phosphoribosyltransferase [Candidatus Micrarchaeota archaeon]
MPCEDFPALLKLVVEKHNLTVEQSSLALDLILAGKATPVQISSFLTALKLKGETVDEITGFVQSVRKNAVAANLDSSNLVDTAGTGGDGTKTFNISTCAAIVASAVPGVKVAKHGNRAASSKCGSADVLEELGVKIAFDAQSAKKFFDETGFVFLFAPAFHPALKIVAPIRRELGFKTVFNILGPLSNPAGAKRQLLGVFDKSAATKMARVLKNLGCEKAIVVSSDTDELSLSSKTMVLEVENGEVKQYEVSPEDFGFSKQPLDSLVVSDRKQSAQKILSVLSADSGAARDIVLLNAGAAVYASGVANSIKEGIELAKKAVDSGAAMKKLELLKETSLKY